MNDWANRPLDGVYAAVFIDAIVVKVRDGQVANRPIYAAIGVSLAGEKDVLGLWAGTGGEGAKFWMAVLTDLRNRGVADVFFLVCDGLKGLPEVVNNVWPLTTVQTCIIHLIRNTFRLASRRDWDRLKRDLKLIYTAPNEAAARAALDELTDTWGARYPAIIRLWENAWAEFIPFLDYDVEIRTVICSTNAIESLNARYRRAVRARGHFPTEQAAMKCLYLVTRSLDPTGKGQARWTDEVETSAERVRHHLRRPLAGSRNLLMKTAGNTVPVTDPYQVAARDLLKVPSRHLHAPHCPAAHRQSHRASTKWLEMRRWGRGYLGRRGCGQRAWRRAGPTRRRRALARYLESCHANGRDDRSRSPHP